MLELHQVSKRYSRKNATLVLDQVSFQLAEGQLLALLGLSGSGKSTLLKTIAGVEPVNSGRIFWRQQEITMLPPERRRIGMVFQEYALFPHLNVLDNVRFGLVESGVSAVESRREAATWLDRLDLLPLLERAVDTLSGGERQRVAVARALAHRPQLLLLDEPFSHLDELMRHTMREMLQRLLRETQLTTVLVTHDQRDAFALADELAILRNGKIIQRAAPETVYRQPADAWIARFLNHRNILNGRLLADEAYQFCGHLMARVEEKRFLGDRMQLRLLQQDQLHTVGLSVREYQALDSPEVGKYLPLAIDWSRSIALPDGEGKAGSERHGSDFS